LAIHYGGGRFNTEFTEDAENTEGERRKREVLSVERERGEERREGSLTQRREGVKRGKAREEKGN
jgi:hypothetical protein